MKDTQTGSSKYKEIGGKKRNIAAKDEISKWGNDSGKFDEYRNKWNMSANEDFLPEHPLHVDIELSNACNLRCKMCVHGMETAFKAGVMNRDLALRLISESAESGVYSIKFNWRGEVTLNKFLPEAVSHAKEKGILEVQINTNGMLPQKDILIKCAENGIDRIIFSIDGFSKETYESIRIGGDYNKLLDTVHNLIEWKKENNSLKPFIRVQMVRTKNNYHEVEDFMSYWGPLVDDVRVSDVMDRGQGGGMSVGDQLTTGRRRCPQPFQRLVVG